MIALLCFALVYGIATETDYYGLKISPDGQFAAYLVDRSVIRGITEGVQTGGKTSIGYFRLSEPRGTKEMIVLEYRGEKPDRGKYGERSLMFSPKSDYVSVLAYNRLYIVKLGNDAVRLLGDPNADVTTVSWDNQGNLLFVANTREGRSLCLKSPRDDFDSTIMIAQNVGPTTSMLAPRSFSPWSPGARFLIFSDLEVPSVFDLSENNAWKVELNQWGNTQVAWAEDRPSAIIGTETERSPFRVASLDLEARVVRELTNDMHESIGSCKKPSLEGTFREADQTWILNCFDRGGLLVRLDTKEVINAGEVLLDRVGPAFPLRAYKSSAPPYAHPRIFESPISGWVMTVVMGRDMLVDKSLEKGILLFSDSSYAGTPCSEITSDGKTAVRVSSSGKISVMSLDIGAAKTLEDLRVELVRLDH